MPSSRRTLRGISVLMFIDCSLPTHDSLFGGDGLPSATQGKPSHQDDGDRSDDHDWPEPG